MNDLTQLQSTAVAASSKRGRWIGLGIGTALIAGLIAIFAWQQYINGQGPVDRGLAPDFTLSLYDGGQLTLSDLRGQVVVVNFWASWCIPCRDEAPLLEQAWRRYRDRGVLFIGVAYLDAEKESLAFLEEFGITYPNGPDLGTRIARDYRLGGVPETFFIGKDGRVVDLAIGPLTETRLISAIETALQQ